MHTARTTTVLVLGLILRAYSHQSPPHMPPPRPKQTPEAALPDDVVKIIVFPPCVDFQGELTKKRRPCPFEVVYELQQSLSEGHLEVFNLLHVEAQYPLPDLSAGKHTLVIPDVLQGFYWPENEQSVPDPMLSCNLGAVSTSIMLEQLWEKTTQHEKSVYDYKPPPPMKDMDDPRDQAAAFRGDDLGFSEFRIPYKHNRELRDAGSLPEVEILGVGFVEGTPAQCGGGTNPEHRYPSPLRDVRLVSTVSHDWDDSIPVLKAARFTVPPSVFTYPNHIRIVGKVKR